MKIAIISLMAGSPWGGSEILWSKTAEIALEEGHSVLISVYRWPEMHPILAGLNEKGAILLLRDRFNSQAGIAQKTWLHFKNRLRFLNRETSGLLKWKPDHILINQGDTFDLSVHHYKLFESIRKHKLKYSLICHSHAQYGEIPGPQIYPRAKEIFLSAQKVFFVSNRMQEITERKLCTQLENASITWNPLNITEPGILPWPEDNIIQFAMVGSLGNNKGHDTLFQCMSSGPWKDRSWKLNIYGKGYGQEYLQDLSRFYQIEERINFFGYSKDIKSIWEKNHLMLLPSAGEGLPISLLEAMLCGRAAVVSDVGGISEVIEEGKTGFIAEAPSVKSFSRALDRAFLLRETWEKMGNEAFLSVASKIHLHPETEILYSISKST